MIKYDKIYTYKIYKNVHIGYFSKKKLVFKSILHESKIRSFSKRFKSLT